MWLRGYVGVPPTPQHTVSHHCTRPPSWGTRANLGGTTNFREKINGKLRRIILLRIDLITFRFAYVRNRNLTCSWLLDCRTPRNCYLWIWIYQITLNSKKNGRSFEKIVVVNLKTLKMEHVETNRKRMGEGQQNENIFCGGPQTMGMNDGFE